MLRLAVLISGGGTDLQSIIDAYQRNEIDCEMALVVSNRESAYGLERAKQAGIPTAVIKDQNELLEKLQEERIDFIVLAGYLAILGKELIQAYPNKIINIHPSLIPSFCGPGMYGLHVHEAALKKGVKVSGATVHFVSEEVDGGPIIYQEAVSIADLDDAGAIQQRVLEVEHRILPIVVSYYCQGKIKIEKGRVRII